MIIIMKTLNEINKVIKGHRGELEEKFKVKAIGVFGSYVKGQQKRYSDIDILVEFKEPIGLFEFMDLEEYLKNLLGTKVDLVSKKALKPIIGEHILREIVYI